MKRKLIALLTLMLMLPALALGEVKKEEIIYARLSSDGALKSLYVVNAFESDGDARVTDYGAYDARVNLTDDAALEQSGDSATFDMQKGRFYYQGDGLDRKLPWTFALAYSLDGVPMPASEIAGKSGVVAVDFSVTNVPDVASGVGMTLQVTFTLDGDKCLRISAPGGTVASAGGDRVITYAVLPGMEAEYRFTFDAVDFTMAGAQIGGVRMVMDADMYASAFTKDLNDAMKALAQNMTTSMLSGMAGGEPVSFVDERNAVTAVQFVVMADGVTLPTPVVEQKEEAPQKGFFDRLLALFGL